MQAIINESSTFMDQIWPSDGSVKTNASENHYLNLSADGASDLKLNHL
jgi:hypothetical protein